ncbi:MAG: lipopolysaccharide biosynthesis protein [Chitinophagaceae bacterium]
MSVKINILKNAGAGLWSKIATVAFRLVQVPVLLSLLGVDDYGKWLVLYTLPSWISLANFGFGSVAGNEMSLAIGEGNMERAVRVFSSTLAIFIGIFIAGSLLLIPVVSFLHWEKLLHLPAQRSAEIRWVFIWFTLSTLLSFFGELYQGRFKAARKAHVSIILYSFRPWVELLAMIIVLQYTKRLDLLALSVFCTTICYIVAARWLSYRGMPALHFKISSVSKELMKPLFRKGFAFQAFPLGNALTYQGTIIIVQLVLGSTAVAIFGSVRTLVRSINQLFELINQVMWPELSLLFGKGDLIQVARLHRIGVATSVAVSLICVLFLAVFGEKIFALWTGGAFQLSHSLLLFFLIPILFNSLWFTSSVIHMASNQHEGLAVRYIIAMALGVLGCAILSYFFGIAGAAASTVISDILLIPYVFKKSLLLTNDTPQLFFKGVLREATHLSRYIKKISKPRIGAA